MLERPRLLVKWRTTWKSPQRTLGFTRSFVPNEHRVRLSRREAYGNTGMVHRYESLVYKISLQE